MGLAFLAPEAVPDTIGSGLIVAQELDWADQS